MWHRDKSVNRTEARKFFQITSKEVEAGPPYLGRKMSVFVCVRKLIESANTHASETAYAVVWVRCFHILPSDRSLNKLLGLPVSMFHVPPLIQPCGKVVTFLPPHLLIFIPSPSAQKKINVLG